MFSYKFVLMSHNTDRKVGVTFKFNHYSNELAYKRFKEEKFIQANHKNY